MSSRESFDMILKFCKKQDPYADMKSNGQNGLYFRYAKERATNYREIVETMILKEIYQ